jgi:hypothetical protein
MSGNTVDLRLSEGHIPRPNTGVVPVRNAPCKISIPQIRK